MLRWMCGALLVLCAAWPTVSEAQDDGQLVAIQQRKFTLHHELDFEGAFEPQDAFAKGLGGEVAYSYHFTDSIAWEVLRGGYLGQIPSGLQTQLSQEFAVAPTQFPLLQYYASSSLVWSPLYGKLARNNGAITHIEAFLTLGPALGRFTNSFAVGPEVGVGFRVFLTRVVSIRFDARDAYFFSGNSKDVVFLSTGFALNMGGND